MDNEVHDLDRGVDNAKPVSHRLEGGLEELLVEFPDDFLPCFGIVDSLHPSSNTSVELLKSLNFLADSVLLKNIQHLLHGNRNRILLSECIAFKESIKDRLGDEVLGQHLNCIILRNLRVQVVPQPA